MRRHLPGLIAFLVTAATSIGFVRSIGVPSLGSPHPADAVLIERYREYELEFQRLVVLTREDSNLAFISERDFCLLERWGYMCCSQESLRAGGLVSVDRWNLYKHLLSALDSGSTDQRVVADRQVFIPVSVEIGPTDGNFETEISEKGYVYSPTEPAPLLLSLDELSSQKPITLYRRLDSDWYLYYRMSVSKPE